MNKIYYEKGKKVSELFKQNKIKRITSMENRAHDSKAGASKHGERNGSSNRNQSGRSGRSMRIKVGTPKQVPQAAAHLATEQARPMHADIAVVGTAQELAQ